MEPTIAEIIFTYAIIIGLIGGVVKLIANTKKSDYASEYWVNRYVYGKK